jgi:RNA polymerase sigma-70 factor (ECF subfamily)
LVQALVVGVEAVDGAVDKAGDDALFGRLYPGLRRFAAATGPPEVEPDDLVQEAVARTLRRHTLSELDDAGAYLRRVILNLAANHRRGLARWRSVMPRLARADDGDDSTPNYASDLADLLRLPPETRAVLYLVEVEGASYAEAAAALGTTEEAARARAARGRQRLRLDLEGEQ